jgi:hypothetical protein
MADPPYCIDPWHNIIGVHWKKKKKQPPPPGPCIPGPHNAVWLVDGSQLHVQTSETVADSPVGMFSFWYRTPRFSLPEDFDPDLDLDGLSMGPLWTLSDLNPDTPGGASLIRNNGEIGVVVPPPRYLGIQVTTVPGISYLWLSSSFDPDQLFALGDGASWHHVLVSWDISSQFASFIVDGVEYRDPSGDASIGTLPTTLRYSSPSAYFAMFALQLFDFVDDKNQPLSSDQVKTRASTWGGLAELYWSPGQLLDFANLDNPLSEGSANYAKFNDDGTPGDLGPDGSGPTGEAPAVYMSGPACIDPSSGDFPFPHNRGSAGSVEILGNGVVSIDSLAQESLLPGANLTIAIGNPEDPTVIFDGPLPPPLDPWSS